MRPALLVALLAAIWGLAPTFGAPSSLWVVPLVAAVAAWWSLSPWRAAAAALAGLVVMALLWSLLAVLVDGADPLRQVGTAAAIAAFHAPVAAGLAAGARLALGRWRARRGSLPGDLPQA